MVQECLLLFLIVFSVPILLSSADDKRYPPQHCPTSFTCEKLRKEIHFPFTNTDNSECGLPITGCNVSEQGGVKLKLGVEWETGIWYEIRGIDQTGEHDSFSIQHPDLLKYLSSQDCRALDYIVPPLPVSPMMSFSINIATLRVCNNPNSDVPHQFSCKGDDGQYKNRYYGFPAYQNPTSFFTEPDPDSECSTIQLPIKPAPYSDPFTFLTADINILVILSPDCHECYHERGGQCRTDPEKADNIICDNAERKHISKAAIIGLTIGCPAALGLLIIVLLCKRRCITSNLKYQSRNIYADRYPNPVPESSTVFFGIPVFSYKELEESTNNFDSARELGDGGFGTVYYGILRDGREVAVKRLYEHNYRRVEQFLNEIAILTRLRHGNLVSFYGCTSRHSRELLLVYEYIPNSTLACHLHGDLAKPGMMLWPLRMKIAIEIASALAYLHASNIIHRDVKTNNILLDNSFCVKVADFGLSRLFPNNVTHISTTPQGTPGYVDPEYRQCYQLTNKSDVYSFGVVLIELISSLPAVDTDRQRDEINLANLAIKKIENREVSELVDPSLGFGTDNKVKRMIESVAALASHCLQLAKECRPSMDEVLEELKRIERGKEKDVTISLGESDVHVDGISIHVDGVSNRYVYPPKPRIIRTN